MERNVFTDWLHGALTALRSLVQPGLPSLPPDVVEYQGERFKLTSPLDDDDSYENNLNRIDPSENARIERAVTQAKVFPGPMTRQQMAWAVIRLNFPVYRWTSLGETPQPDGTILAGFAVEVPRADKQRVVVFRGRGDAYTLIDDFVSSVGERIMQVRLESGQLVYSSLEGEQIVARPLVKDPQAP